MKRHPLLQSLRRALRTTLCSSLLTLTTATSLLSFVAPASLHAQIPNYDDKTVEEIKIVPKNLPSGTSLNLLLKLMETA
jgi:hypothetical protein